MKEKFEKLFAGFNRIVLLDSVLPEQKDQEAVKVTVEDIEELKNASANKSKIKVPVLEKLKKFYYLHIYETIKIGQANDEEYKEVLNQEIKTQEEKLEKTKEKSVANVFNAAVLPAKTLEIVNEIETKKQENIENEIENLKEKVQEIEVKQAEENLNQEMEQTLQQEVQGIMQQNEEQIVEPTTEENNQIEEQKDIQNNEEISLQPMNEGQEEVRQEETPVEEEQPKEELIIPEEKREFMAAIEFAFDQAMQKVEEKHAEEVKQVTDDAANKITEAENIVKQVSDEANTKLADMKKENEQLQSHYEQATAMVEKQRKEIEEKDETIAELNEQVATIAEKDAEIERLKKIENEFLVFQKSLSSFIHPQQEIETRTVSRNFGNDIPEEEHQKTL